MSTNTYSSKSALSSRSRVWIPSWTPTFLGAIRQLMLSSYWRDIPVVVVLFLGATIQKMLSSCDRDIAIFEICDFKLVSNCFCFFLFVYYFNKKIFCKRYIDIVKQMHISLCCRRTSLITRDRDNSFLLGR